MLKPAEKKKALAAALKEINKIHGEGAVYQMGDAKFAVRESFPTGSIALDILLRIGGFPRNMITELYGKEGGGKSTLCMSATGLAQKQGAIVAYIDQENAFDPLYASKMGVNVRDLVFSQPDDGEQAFDVADQLMDSGAVDIIIIDSIANMMPRTEAEGEIGDQNVALLSRLVSPVVRRLGIKVRKNNVALILINQLRDVIGAVGAQKKTSTPGGRALRHNASLRMEVSRIGQLKIGDKVVGGRTRVYIEKSRICPPFQAAEFDIIYGKGISREAELVDLATEYGIFEKQGNTYVWGDDVLGVGREKTRELLAKNADFFKKVYTAVLAEATKRRETEDRPLSE